MQVEIRAWAERDGDVLQWMIRDFLRISLERGGDLLPTDANVLKLLQIGLCWAAAGRPCLVAQADGGEALVGYVEWGWDELPPFDVRWRTCFGLGSYVMPGARHQGVCHALRERAEAMCRAAGIERITGPIILQHPVGMAEMLEEGWTARTVNMERWLSETGEVMS